MRAALHAEWTKLRTVLGTWWLLVSAMGATVALSAGVVALVGFVPGSGGADPVELSLTGVQLGQAPVAILAVLAVGGEYGSGLLGCTFTAMPRRVAVLAAKAVTLAGAVAVAAAIAVFGSLLAGRAILPDGVAFDGETLRSAAGAVVYLVSIALLGLGVGAVARDSAAGIGVVLGLLYLFPMLAQVIADPGWRRLLTGITPTTDALGVTAGWAAAALVLGGVLLLRRDVP